MLRATLSSLNGTARVPGFSQPENRINAILLCKGLRMSSFFTIGHSNHDFPAWLALLRQHER